MHQKRTCKPVKGVRTMVPILVILTFACFILIEIALEHRARKKAELRYR